MTLRYLFLRFFIFIYILQVWLSPVFAGPKKMPTFDEKRDGYLAIVPTFMLGQVLPEEDVPTCSTCKTRIRPEDQAHFVTVFELKNKKNVIYYGYFTPMFKDPTLIEFRNAIVGTLETGTSQFCPLARKAYSKKKSL